MKTFLSHPVLTGVSMVRSARDSRIDSRSARHRLKAKKSVYRLKLQPGLALGYYKPSKGDGSWIAFVNPSRHGDLAPIWRQKALGLADDHVDADGTTILDYAQAQAKAREALEAWGREDILRATGEVMPKGPYTVSSAMAAYFKDGERSGMKGIKISVQVANVHILPVFGKMKLEKLTRIKIAAWHSALAGNPRRKTGKTRLEPVFLAAPTTDDAKRARKNTANRILAILKRALNLAVEQGAYLGPTPWRDVKPFRNVQSSRKRFLSVAEQVRLVNVCPPDFRRLVQAALYTGARYGELGRLAIRDYNPDKGTVFIEFSKSGKARYIILTEEANAYFSAICAGRQPEERILLRDAARRTKYKEEGNAWLPSDQTPFMLDACEDASLERLAFHELRHTYASCLVNVGVPLVFVAEQLGHVDTRMVERYYGHLCPSARADAIRTLVPALGLGGTQNVAPLKLAVGEG